MSEFKSYFLCLQLFHQERLLTFENACSERKLLLFKKMFLEREAILNTEKRLRGRCFVKFLL